MLLPHALFNCPFHRLMKRRNKFPIFTCILFQNHSADKLMSRLRKRPFPNITTTNSTPLNVLVCACMCFQTCVKMHTSSILNSERERFSCSDMETQVSRKQEKSALQRDTRRLAEKCFFNLSLDTLKLSN